MWDELWSCCGKTTGSRVFINNLHFSIIKTVIEQTIEVDRLEGERDQAEQELMAFCFISDICANKDEDYPAWLDAAHLEQHDIVIAKQKALWDAESELRETRAIVNPDEAEDEDD